MFDTSSPSMLAVQLLIVLLGAATGALLRSRRRRKMLGRRLAEATGHPSGQSDRVRTAIAVAERLAELGMVAERQRSLVTARGLDGKYVVHVLEGQIAIGYDTNQGRIFLAVVHSTFEAQQVVARHAGIPLPA